MLTAPIPLLIVATLLAIVAFSFVCRHFVKRASRRRQQAAPPRRRQKVYFLRWVTEEDYAVLSRYRVSFEPCNIGALRAQLNPPPPPDAEAPPAEAGLAGQAPVAQPGEQSLQPSAEQSPQPSAEQSPQPPAPIILNPDDDGILVREGALKSVLDTLGFEVAAKIPTDLENEVGPIIELVAYRKIDIASKYKFSMGRRDKNLDRIHAITTSLLTARLLTNIEFAYGPGPRLDEGTFRVVFTGMPRPDEQGLVGAPEQLWGLTLRPDQWQTRKPSGLGTAVLTAGGYPLAELVGFDLFIHADLFAGNDFEQAAGLYTRILQKLQPALTLNNLLDSVVKAEGGESQGERANLETRASGFGRQEGTRQSETYRRLCDRLLLPVVGKNVAIKYGAAASDPFIPEKADRTFTVVLCASPLGIAEEPAPRKLFGLPVLHSAKAFAPSGRGLPLPDWEGYFIGELVDDTLYVHFDIVREGSLVEARIFARFLSAVKKALLSRALTGEALTAAERSQFVQACYRQVAPLASPGLTSNRATLAKDQAELHQLLRQARHEERALFQLEAAPDGELGEEFDRLLDLASVVDVKVSESKLHVSTEVLYCRDPRSGYLHEIGAFDIQIPTDEDGTIRWINRTRKVDGYHNGMNAPHVYDDGHACLGNVADLFPELIAKRDFASAVQVAIAFVEAVNVDDLAGQQITNWPIASR